MPRDGTTRNYQRPLGADAANEIRISAIYQRDGAVALTRSQFFDPTTEIQELLAWAKAFEDLDIEFVRLEIEAE